MDASEERWQKIMRIWKQNQWLYVVAGFLAGTLVSPFLIQVNTNLTEFLVSLVPNAIAIAFTVFFIDRQNRRREQERELRELKARLVREAGSYSRAIAANAVSELNKADWLEGESGLLKGEDFYNADLRDAHLAFVNFSDAFLGYAKLSEVNLYSANLKQASLWRANLTSANLRWADMSDTLLAGAIFDGADLYMTNLQGATLLAAEWNNGWYPISEAVDDQELQQIMPGAIIYRARFDKATKLPNGDNWTPDVDMRIFTDFWRPPQDKEGKYPWWYKPNNSE